MSLLLSRTITAAPVSQSAGYCNRCFERVVINEIFWHYLLIIRTLRCSPEVGASEEVRIHECQVGRISHQRCKLWFVLIIPSMLGREHLAKSTRGSGHRQK